MPFLAYELDAFENCGAIGAACGLRPEQVSHGMLLLWRHCWRNKTDLVTTGHLRGFFFGVDPSEALVTFEHLAPSETRWRVRGVEAWLRVQTAQSDAGKAHAGNLKRGRMYGKAPAGPRLSPGSPSGSAPALSANSQQPTATDVKALRAKKPPAPLKPDSPPHPRHHETVDGIWATWKAQRGTDYVPAPKGADFKAVRDLLAVVEPEAVLAAWAKALRHVGYPTVSSVVELQAHFGKFHGAGPPRNPKAPTQISTDHEGAANAF